VATNHKSTAIREMELDARMRYTRSQGRLEGAGNVKLPEWLSFVHNHTNLLVDFSALLTKYRG
jgi:hypothetical protein